jgi:hypothetical protein
LAQNQDFRKPSTNRAANARIGGHSFIREKLVLSLPKDSWTVWWLNSKASKDFKHEILIGRQKMTEIQKNHTKKAVETVKRRLVFILSLLGLSAAALILRVGEAWWPLWLADYRTRIIAVLVFAFIMVVASFPLMIESSRRPRNYPGLGKNPYIDP